MTGILQALGGRGPGRSQGLSTVSVAGHRATLLAINFHSYGYLQNMIGNFGRHGKPSPAGRGRRAVITAPSPATKPVSHEMVRAVVVSWNGAHLLPACLDSLLAQTVASDLEVLVVDNASEDNTAAVLAERYPQVIVVRSGSNLGFAGGADLGLAGFTGPFITLLNNDATLAADAVERMVSVLQQPGNERVGAVTAKILLAGAYRLERGFTEATAPTGSYQRDDGWLVPADPDSPGAMSVVNSTGNLVTRRGTATDRDWLRSDGEESQDTDVFGFCGGAAVLRRAALDDVGGFDRELFLYYEDTDLSWRLRAAGWTIRYCEQAVARHLHAASSDSASPLFRYYNTRNSLMVFARHAPMTVVLGSFARQLVGSALAGLRRSEPREVTLARIRGLTAFLRQLPGTLRERKRWRSTAENRAEVAKLLR
jgi:N-acetylglucosaminyl-diphospho-decaprenol L-rhamnosyltransferase